MSVSAPVPRRLLSACAVMVAAFLALCTPAFAVGEPTLTITMSSYALTAGTTADVTFQFSATPSGFDNTDVDLSNANGTLSPVTVTADDRVYTATLTPTPGVDDDSNRITVGTGWTDSVGVAPLGPSFSPNFTVHTAASSGGSSCGSPSVRLAQPNGGESFDAGQVVNVF